MLPNDFLSEFILRIEKRDCLFRCILAVVRTLIMSEFPAYKEVLFNN